MKSKITLFGFAIFLIMAFAMPLDALGQEKGKGGPPSWAPAHGYRAQTSHIYFPDDNFYFDLQNNMYIYMEGSKWQVSAKLPSLFAGIDLKGAVRVELELGSDSPQKYNAEHKVKYKGKSAKVKEKNGNKGKGK
ncbi:MAG: hypothetical protein ABFR32_11190, partial [Bacteroidota bacterium]